MKETEKSVQNLFPHQDQLHYIGGAVDLINHYYSQGLMLPVTIEKYQQLAADHKLMVAVTEDNEVIGTVAYTYDYPKEIWELGGLAIKEGWLHQGIATVLIREMLKQQPHGKTIAIANGNSLPLLKKLGATEISYPNNLPPEIFGPCVMCPNKPEQGCCDTLLSLAPVLLKLLAEVISDRERFGLLLMISQNKYPHLTGLNTPAEQW